MMNIKNFKSKIITKLNVLKSQFGFTRLLYLNYYSGVTFGYGVQVTGVSDVEIGSGSCIADNVWLNTNVRGKGVTIKIGECVLIGRSSVCNSSSMIEIGDYTFTAAGVLISNSYHKYDNIYNPYLAGTKDCGELLVEENVWIGFNAVVYGNITVGRGSVIGANSVVNSDVPPFSLVVGNPHKIVKMYDPKIKKWIKISNDNDYKRVLKSRKEFPLLTRDEYRNMLHLNSKMKRVDPLCAGNSKWC